jgi:predicted acyltransferase (DUF342 family)
MGEQRYVTRWWQMARQFFPHGFVAVAIVSILVTGTFSGGACWAQSTLDPALAFGVISGGSVTLGKDASASGSVGALNDLTLKSNASVSADGTILGKKLKLDKNAAVNGICATGGGKITLGKDAACLGGMDTSGTSPALVPLQNFASLGATACPPAGISEGALDLGKDGVQMLTANDTGVTVFDYTSIKLGKDATITITIPAGAMAVISDSGALTTDKDAQISSLGSATSNLLVIANSAKLGSDTFIQGTLMTAKTCKLGKDADVDGQLYCTGNATIGADASVDGNLLSESVATAVTCPE